MPREGETTIPGSRITVAALRRKVALSALGSRTLVLITALVTRFAIDAYDTSAELRHGKTGARWLALGANWDAEYFTSIAIDGYKYEQMHAFFPLVPILMKILGSALHMILLAIFGLDLSIENAHILAGIIVSNVSFILAAIALFDLSLQTFSDANWSYRSAIVFCFTPASVFMSAVYTEAPFSLFSFVGMRLACQVGGNIQEVDKNLWLASLVFGIATLSRSNGAVLAGYLGYRMLRPFLLDPSRFRNFIDLASASAKVIWAIVVAAVLPLVIVLGYATSLYCTEALLSQDIDKTLVLGSMRPWCTSKIPNIYSFVQEEYWNQGFLRFYRLEQIPNFLLAMPTFIWSTRSILWSIKSCKASKPLGIVLLPFILHLIFLVGFCMLCMHVQVITRFVSACPLIYWFAAQSTRDLAWIVPWSCVFTILGTALFVAYYPFV